MNKLIVVDIQPAYSKYFPTLDLKEFVKLVKKQDEVLYLYNGTNTGLSEDSEESIKDWLYDLGIRTQDHITFYDKGYAFFRGWMDYGIDDWTIIDVAKLMMDKKIYDSRDLESSDLEPIISLDDIPQHDPLFIPDLADLNSICKFNHSLICGGGRNECLKEIELLLGSLDISTQKVERLIY